MTPVRQKNETGSGAQAAAGSLVRPDAHHTAVSILRADSPAHSTAPQVQPESLEKSGGIPFYFLKIDIAGNVLKRSSATRFQFARFGGPCPVWNVHQSFSQPGRNLVQLAATPDGTTYLCIARTVSLSGGSYLSRPRAVAVGLGCEIAYADQTVYSKGLDLKDIEAADPIGPGCRACERANCRHRALPPIGCPLDVGTAERGVVPYRIETKTQPPLAPKRGERIY
jgi:predicted transcriptional regulator